jgi:hypothetical protein
VVALLASRRCFSHILWTSYELDCRFSRLHLLRWAERPEQSCQGCGQHLLLCTELRVAFSRFTVASYQPWQELLHTYEQSFFLVKDFPDSAQVGLNFMTYELVRKYFTPEGEQNPSALRKLAAGAISGAVAQTCTFPL